MSCRREPFAHRLGARDQRIDFGQLALGQLPKLGVSRFTGVARVE
ncbi:MAG TPA: hypothetical protein VFQ12_00675 [Thermoleophilaceae bacterium]|nr:hypothetical protein [Thermoleophilaceae bacterium]